MMATYLFDPMETNVLTVSGLDQLVPTAAQTAYLERDRLLELARKGKRIADSQSAARAADVLKELKGFSRGIETARKVSKEPVLRLGQAVDQLAHTLTDDIEAEASRISALLGEWQAEQNRIAEEARRKAWEQEQLIRREAEAKERAEQERLAKEEAERRAAAEAERRALEEKAAKARSEKRRLELEAQAKAAAERAEAEAKAAAERAAAEGLKRDEETAIAIGAAHGQAAAVIVAKPQGVSARRNVEFEVTDVVALYEACPPLVNLVPNKAAIKAALKQLPEGKTLPGIKHWWTSGVVVR